VITEKQWYLTKAGRLFQDPSLHVAVTVDDTALLRDGDVAYSYECGVCGEKGPQKYSGDFERLAHEEALKHASTCEALPVGYQLPNGR
jgi:hypothetical protein